MLAKDPVEINLGRVVQEMEPNLDLVECFDMVTNTCPIAPVCDLKGVLGQAQQSFVGTLLRYTLADLGTRPQKLRKILKMPRAVE